MIVFSDDPVCPVESQKAAVAPQTCNIGVGRVQCSGRYLAYVHVRGIFAEITRPELDKEVVPHLQVYGYCWASVRSVIVIVNYVFDVCADRYVFIRGPSDRRTGSFVPADHSLVYRYLDCIVRGGVCQAVVVALRQGYPEYVPCGVRVGISDIVGSGCRIAYVAAHPCNVHAHVYRIVVFIPYIRDVPADQVGHADVFAPGGPREVSA